MRTELLSPNLKNIGGIQRYTSFVSEALKEGGADLRVVELKNADLISKSSFFLRAFLIALFFRPRVVFLTHLAFSPAAVFISKTLRIPYVVFAHGIEVWDLNDQEKKWLSGATKVLPVSRFTQEKLLAQIPGLESKLKIVPNVAEELPRNDFHMREALGVPKNSKIILTVSRLAKSEQYKGYDKVLMVLPEILKEVPDLVYVIVGRGDDEERIKTIIKKENVGESVILAGEVERGRLRNFYEESDLFVMPSTGEGFGIVFLEALMCGKPVIAGNKDGSRDAVLDGELGVLIDPDDPTALKNSILGILKGEIVFDSKTLKNRAEEEYGYENFKTKIKALINEFRET